MQRWLLGAVASLAVVPGAASAAPAEAVRVAAGLAAWAGPRDPGCAVGVFRDGAATTVAAAGVAEVTTLRPLDADTQFYAGSVSKTFTALAVAQLVDAGIVRLDEDVRRWLPELPHHARPITVAMLLHHTSGVRDVLSLLELSGHADITTATRSEALALLLRQTDTDFPPGSRLAYSNGGYLLLSEIVARASSLPFETYVQKRILEPLGMTRSLILSGAPLAGDTAAKGYRVGPKGLSPADAHPLFGGSGGLVTTVRDLARWDHDIDSGGVVWTPRVRALMLAPGTYSDGSRVMGARAPQEVQGAGLMIGPDGFNHFGSSLGFKAAYVRLDDRRVGLAMLCNRGDFDIEAGAGAILALLDGRLPPLPARGPAPPPAGRYRSPDIDATYEIAALPGGAIQLTVRPDQASAPATRRRLPRQPDGAYDLDGRRLVPDPNGQRFSLEYRATRLAFVRAGADPSP